MSRVHNGRGGLERDAGKPSWGKASAGEKRKMVVEEIHRQEETVRCTNPLDNKKSCAALFIDLSKEFDTVDHRLLLQRLHSIGFSSTVLSCFFNYLSGRTQCVALNKCSSSLLEVKMGVPQGSVLGPILFSIDINNVDRDLKQTKVHLYADEPFVYLCYISVRCNDIFTVRL